MVDGVVCVNLTHFHDCPCLEFGNNYLEEKYMLYIVGIYFEHSSVSSGR